jgi:hypothetical protein
MLLYDLWTIHKLRLVSVFTAAAAVIAVGAQMLLLHPDRRYEALVLGLKPLLLNSFTYLRFYSSFWREPHAPLLSFFLLSAVTIATCYGLWQSIRSGIRIYDLFFVLYMAVMIAWPFPVERYLFPVVPIVVIYFLCGLRLLLAKLPARSALVSTAVVAASVMFVYGLIYFRADHGPLREGLFDPEFVDVCRFLRSNTQPDDHILFDKPRLLSLATGRAAAICEEAASPAAVWTLVRLVNASYLLTADLPDEDFLAVRPLMQKFVSTYYDSLVLVYRNRHYQLFRIQRTEGIGLLDAPTARYASARGGLTPAPLMPAR